MELDPDAIQTRSEALIGQVLGGRYRIDSVLGIGAMGAVFRAYHTGLLREVAVKLLHRDLMASDEMRARFAREAAAISKLDHPNCVRITDFGSDDEFQYLVMELLQGTALSSAVDQPLPPQRAMEIADEVLAGLEHAHGHGLVHRDIKPDNIFLVQEDGGKQRAKVLDFGIVKLQEQQGGPQLTKMGMIFGTPHFMSPEQATGGEVDVRSDLYAVGIVLHLMLSGQLPFDSDEPLKVLRQQIRDEPPPLPATVPAPLRELVTKLLAKDPNDRYPTATAARAALASVRKSLEPPVQVPIPAPIAAAPPLAPITPPPSSPGPGIVSPSLTRPRWPPSWWPASREAQWILGGIGLLAVVVVIAIASGGGDDEVPATPPDQDVADARGKMAALLGEKTDDAKPADDATPRTRDGDGDDDGTTPTDAADDDADPSTRGLQASLASVDALIAAREFEAARITLGPLLEAYANEARLHWRMAQVLTALGGADNRAAALDSQAAAIAADASLLDDEAFTTELMALVDDPKLRVAAVALAIDALGSRVDDRLVEWLNVQTKPLDHALRHRIIEHLEGHGRGDEINRPLQRALDLWQASTATSPCEAFTGALDEAIASPDSFLVGTLHGVSVPRTPATPDQEPAECPGAAEKLDQARTLHDARYMGIEPVVPKAYRKRPSGKRGR